MGMAWASRSGVPAALMRAMSSDPQIRISALVFGDLTVAGQILACAHIRPGLRCHARRDRNNAAMNEMSGDNGSAWRAPSSARTASAVASNSGKESCRGRWTSARTAAQARVLSQSHVGREPNHGAHQQDAGAPDGSPSDPGAARNARCRTASSRLRGMSGLGLAAE